MRNRFFVWFVVIVIVFLAGFLPEYAKAKRLDNDLRRASQESTLAELRDQAGLVYFLASQKNYGLAGGAATRFFARAGDAIGQIHDANASKPLQDLLNARDKITAELAKGDPGVLNDLQTLYVNTRRATGRSTGEL
jgi:hypothetical protein